MLKEFYHHREHKILEQVQQLQRFISWLKNTSRLIDIKQKLRSFPQRITIYAMYYP